MEISSEDLDELLSCISSLADMMEPYYKQCNGADEAYDILEKYKRKQPHTTSKIIPARCAICSKTFERSRSGTKRLLDANQQNVALSNHLISAHGLEDYKERKKYEIKSRVEVKHWDTYQDYLDNCTTLSVEKHT